MFDQQSVQFLAVTVENSETTAHDNLGKDCKLFWTVNLMVPDDDNPRLPPPKIFILSATVVVHRNDDDTSNETLRFSTRHAFALSMTMAMDEWGNELYKSYTGNTIHVQATRNYKERTSIRIHSFKECSSKLIGFRGQR
jgi:hypothetical protein